MKINKGKVENKTYRKNVVFSKAVLWRDRELSIALDILDAIEKAGVTKLEFKDIRKGEIWSFKADQVLEKGRIKRVGQEQQFYFPIDLALKRAIDSPATVGSKL